MSGFGIRQVGLDRCPVHVPCSGNASHEKDLQRHKGGGPLVSSQEQRAAIVLGISRSSTGRFVPLVVYIRFRLFAVPESRSRQLSMMPWGQEGSLSPGRTDPPRPVPPRPAAPPRAAPSRPARGMSGLWARKLCLVCCIIHQAPCIMYHASCFM